MLVSSEIFTTYTTKHPRLTNQLILAGLTLVGCLIATIFAAPDQALLETLSVGTGYIGLLFILVSLVIGPLNMLKVRKNPVNLNLRRDIGIWAGLTSLGHVLFSAALQLSWGDSLLGFFFYQNGTPKFNLFGISDLFGLVGALVILFLLVLSNNYFLKKLKGKNWKKMQRFNYLLFVVALVHTFTQQANSGRNAFMVFSVIALAAGVMVAQSLGFIVYRQRSQQRNSASTPVRKGAVAITPRVGTRAQMSSPQPTRTTPPPVVYNYRYRLDPKRDNPSLRLALFGLGGIIAFFLGFEAVAQGPELVKMIASAATDNGDSNSADNSSSDNGFQINLPSFSQPSIRTHHS